MTKYAIAHNVKGFKSTSIRVKVTRVDGNYAFVVTADLLDAGTKLVLDINQIEYEKPAEVQQYITGLVLFS